MYFVDIDVSLGEGNDSYLGSIGTDRVFAADEARGVTDADEIDTGEGWDHVTSGRPGQPVSDTVVLGADGDLLKLAGYPTSLASYDAGETPYDRIELDGGDTGWLIDQRAHRISRDDHPSTAHIAGFNTVVVTQAPRLRYTGGEFAEALVAPGAVAADMGGGNDTLAITAGSARRLGRIDMGAGRDQLEIVSNLGMRIPSRISVDLRQKFTLVTGSTTVRRRVAVEGILLQGIHDVRVRGSARANLVMVWGACDVWLDGDRGPIAWWQYAYGSRGRPVTMFGGPGDDRLTGMRSDDRLYGGSGHDIATGRERLTTSVSPRSVAAANSVPMQVNSTNTGRVFPSSQSSLASGSLRLPESTPVRRPSSRYLS